MLQENYDVSMIASLKPLGFLKQMGITVLAPFITVKCMVKGVLMRVDHNYIKRKVPYSGKKTINYIDGLDVGRIKAVSKSLKQGINDVFTALICTTLHEYFTLHKNEYKDEFKGEIPTGMQICVPFSLR